MNKINNFFISEPQWVDVEQSRSLLIPAQVNDWLQESGSLTLRMKSSLDGNFDVSVEGEGFSPAFLEDAGKLEQNSQGDMFVREVVLSLASKPHVFARTTIPEASLQSLQQLATLGKKPLGEVIFSYPELKRTSLDIAKISAQQLMPKVRMMLDKENTIWARRSVYDIKGDCFIVSEFFLPVMF